MMTSHTDTDAIDLLMSDHRVVDALFMEYEALDGEGHERQRQLVDEMIHELSVHAAIEEQVLYPFIRRELPDGEKLAEEGIREHQEVKELLADLEQFDPRDAAFDQRVGELIGDVRHHVDEEETEFFPKLREVASPDELVKLGRRLETAKKFAPTHPHPEAPTTPPGNVVAGAAAAVIDKARDAFKRD